MAAALAPRGLVILDRDGVINRDSDAFVKSPGEWLPLPGSIAAIAALSEAGFTVTVASNQSGLARGLFDRAALRAMHRKLRRLVDAAGVHVDRIVVCPHGPDDGFVGDSTRDLEAARAAGATPVLVRTGNGARTEASLPKALATVAVYDDLAAAAAALVGR